MLEDFDLPPFQRLDSACWPEVCCCSLMLLVLPGCIIFILCICYYSYAHINISQNISKPLFSRSSRQLPSNISRWRRRRWCFANGFGSAARATYPPSTYCLRCAPRSMSHPYTRSFSGSSNGRINSEPMMSVLLDVEPLQ